MRLHRNPLMFKFKLNLRFACAHTLVSVKSKPAGDGTYSITMAAIPDRVFTLSLVDGRPRLQTTISGKLAYISRAFVEAEVSWSRLPVTESAFPLSVMATVMLVVMV